MTRILKNIEHQLNPEVMEIKPIDAFQISTATQPGRGAESAIDGSEETSIHTQVKTYIWPLSCTDNI